MRNIIKMTPEERKEEFIKYLNAQVKSASRYVGDLERGFEEAPIGKHSAIFDITDPELLEDREKTKDLRESTVFSRDSIGGTAGLAGLNWYVKFLKESRDSYYDFMNHFGIKPKELFKWGMDAIIFPPSEQVKTEWENLQRRIFNNGEVYIRGYGRDAQGTQLYISFYKFLLDNENVKKDPTNNNKPQSNIKRMTGLERNKGIYNYQVSHIWGKTKNVFLFEAPWNICYTPKIIDPFTGHETKGDLPKQFQEYFLDFTSKKYKKYILEYNAIVSKLDVKYKLEEFCKKNSIHNEQFVKDAIEELSPIDLTRIL